MKRIITLVTLFVFILSGISFSQQPLKKIGKKNTKSKTRNNVVHPTTIKEGTFLGITRPLRELSKIDSLNIPKSLLFNYNEELKERNYPFSKTALPKGKDPILQNKNGIINNSKALLQVWEGQAMTSGQPTDANGSVNSDYYFQMINSTYDIYDKNNNSIISGNINTLFNGVTGANRNDGDPIVLYDEQADRWFISEFSVPTMYIGSGNDYMLIAVSVTNNPTGSYYAYSFDVDDGPDYPKFGIWQDGYYMGVNNTSGNDIYVFERSVILAGGANPKMVGFNNPNRPSSGFHCVPPADNDGAFAPTGEPGIFVTINDDAWGGSDQLWIFELDVDWNTPGNSTFSRVQTINVPAFDSNLGSGWDNIAQKNTSQELDGIPQIIMNRPQYRNFGGGDERIVCCHSVDVDNSDHAGVRWYELQKSGGTWSIRQNGTYAPDGHSRWMGSITENGSHEIAIGYSISSSSLYPGIRYCGQSSSENASASGNMNIAETTIFNGSVSQTSGNRWGDYSNLSVDPSDDHTFWFTTQYANGNSSPKTKISEFELSSLPPPSVTSISPTNLYKDKGKQLTITGSDLLGCSFDIGGITGSVVSNNGSTAIVTFPAGNYTNGTLTASNTGGSDNSQSITINTRNTIPVVSGAGITSDNHPTILSAVNGLHAWYETTAFNAGDLPGTKTINVNAGTYTDEVVLNSELNPTATNPLIIQNNSGDVVTVNATGNDYGFNLGTVDYVTLKGFQIHSANNSNIYVQGNNCNFYFNKSYSSSQSGIKIENGSSNNIHHNLAYGNTKYGIHILNSNSNIIKNNTLDDNGGNYSPASITLLDEGFEGSFEPTGWTQYDVTGDNSTHVWQKGAFSGPVAGPDGSANYALITYDTPKRINRALETKSIDLTGYASADLTFYMYKNGTWDEVIYIEISTDGGGSGGTWTELTHIGGSGTDFGGWSPLQTISLNAYTGNTISVRFRYYQPSDDNSSAIDVVKIQATPPAVNTGACLYVESGTNTDVQNNILVAKSGNDAYYTLKTESGITVSSAYNTYYTTNTNLFDYNGTQNNSGPIGTGDLTGNPLFVSNSDYHIQSTNGSYPHPAEWPPEASASAWNNDASDSPALDTGNPADSYANEPASGGRINQGAFGNTVQASKTVSAVTISWTGANGNNWKDMSNWSPAQIPTSADDVVIADVTNQPIINAAGSLAECHNMTIDNGADITIDVDGQMTVNGSITNNAGTSGLIINSDDTGTGSLIQNTSGGVDATVNCRLSSSGRQWHMIASPITDASLSLFPSVLNLYYYDESTADYWTGTDYDAGSTSGWTDFTSGNMTVGKGYIYNYFATTLTYTGQLNDNTSSGSISVPYTNNGVNAPNGSSYDDFDGWNLIGNPYTSAINWDDASVAHATANLNDAIYTYDDTNLHNYTSYAGGTGTNGGTQYIPAMQGFYVKGDATEAGGTLNIGAAARVHNAQGYWKTNYSTPDNFIRLKISATNGYTDETVIRMLPEATSDMDNGTDAYKLFTWDKNVPQIYTKADGSQDYSINTIKTIESDNISIPLKVIQTGDNYKIDVTEFNFDNINVYLKDNLKNETIEIGLNDVFELTADETDSENRYELIFEKSTSGIVLAENSPVTLYPNPNNGQFYLTVNNNLTDYTVTISNITGQVIYKNKFKDNTSKILNLTNQNSGIYFVKITFIDNSSVTKKIVIE